MSEQDDLIQEFLVESYENLDRLDSELVTLEESPDDKETLSSIFRTIHTIKGTCGFLEFVNLEAVTHAGENLLSAIRDGSVGMDSEIASTLLKLVDAVREMLSTIEETGAERDEDYADLVKTLKTLQENGSPVASTEGGVDTPVSSDMPQAEQGQASVETAPSPKEEEHGKSRISDNNIRVHVEQLDQLMNLAGELVLARNQILQHTAISGDATANATSQRLNLITSELQEGIMKIRMQQIGILWSKFPRVVRDLAMQCGKEARLVMEGKDTELDKSVLEAIKDPLTHLVRNAIDHGIENPEERVAAGKPAEGRLVLRAFHESGQVVIEIQDDGRGICAKRVQEKALERGLITLERMAGMSERQMLDLVFQPGFSTAPEVTNLSGRGVGMDVVKTNIEKIGGTVDLESTDGLGSTVRIRIPLTLAIIPALVATVGGDRYAIPQVNLVELVRLDGDDALNGIEDLHGAPVYRLRGNLLPLVFLNRVLGIDKDSTNSGEEHDEPQVSHNIVVVQADDRQFGLVVDEINDTEEIVVKPLDKQIKSVPVYAGTTIMGDGRVALILDVMGIAQRANVLSGKDHGFGQEGESHSTGSSEELRTFLVLNGPEKRRMAIELDRVSRLEEISLSKIERAGDRDVVQYRDEIMPLVYVSKALGLEPTDCDSDTLQVVVHARAGHSAGIVVDSITDIVDASVDVSMPSNSKGIAMTVVIDGHVSDVLDLNALLDSSFRDDEIDEVHTTEMDQGPAVADTTRQYCTFYLGELYFGVDVRQVQEVLRYQEMTRVPLTGQVVEGLINLRGQTVTALDMRERLGLPSREEEGTESDEETRLPMNVVLRTVDGEVSVLVDRIGDVLTLDDEPERVPATVEEDVRALISGIYKLPGALLLVLDIEKAVAVGESEKQLA